MSKKVMLINYVPGEECRIAVVVDGKVEELYQERASSESHVGNIYKGKVTNVEPSIQAAFVEFGLERNGFLHISDLHPKYFPSDIREETELVGLKTRRSERPLIQKSLRKGQEVLVQVLKEGLGNKGPTLTTYLSIPGRFLVMMPNMEKLGVSRKVDDDEARRSMKKILDELDPPKGFGFIVRTAGIGRTRSEIHRDLIYLQRMWRSIEGRMKTTRIGELFAESDLLIRTIRDVYSPDISQVIVDDLAAAQRASDFLAITGQESQGNVLYYNDPIPLFHRFGVEKQIESINSRVVPLPSGGSLVIETTEALVAIDVNSGKNRDNRDADQTAYKVNLEAVDEICRQLRLRDLGGVIVNDLIDMRNPRHRRDVEDRFAYNLNSDRARTRTHPISQFGILEMTRQRMRPSLAKSVFMDCPACSGVGIVKNPESVALEAMRRLAVAMQRDAVAQIELTVSPDVAFHLLNRKRVGLVKLEQSYGKPVLVRVNANGPLDAISLVVYNAADQILETEISMHFPDPKVETIAPSVNPADDGLMEEIKQTMEEAERERQERNERKARQDQARLERQLAHENAVLENESDYPGQEPGAHPGQDGQYSADDADRDALDDEIAARASATAPDFASELNEIVDDTRPVEERDHRQPVTIKGPRRVISQAPPVREREEEPRRVEPVARAQGYDNAQNGSDGPDDQGSEGEGGKRRRRRRRRGGRGSGGGGGSSGNVESINDDNRGNIKPREPFIPKPVIHEEHDEQPHQYDHNPLAPIEDPDVQIGQYQGAPPEKLEKLAKRDLFSLLDDHEPQPGNVREPDPQPVDEYNEPNGNIKPPPDEEQHSDNYGIGADQGSGERRGRRRRGRRGRSQGGQGGQDNNQQSFADNQGQNTGPLAVDPSDQAVNAESGINGHDTHAQDGPDNQDNQGPQGDGGGQDDGQGGGRRRGRRGRRGRGGSGGGGDRPENNAPKAPIELSPDDLIHTLKKMPRSAPLPPPPPVELPPDDLSHMLKLNRSKRAAAALQKAQAERGEQSAFQDAPAPRAAEPVAPVAPVIHTQEEPPAPMPVAIAEPVREAQEKPQPAPRTRKAPPSRSAITAVQGGTPGPKPALKPVPAKPYAGFRSLKKGPASSEETPSAPSADNNEPEKG